MGIGKIKWYEDRFKSIY